MRNIRKLIPYVLLFTSLIFLMPVPSGCTGSDSIENNKYLELLSLIPADAKDEGCFALIDYELFRQANGISLFDSDNQKINQEEYFRILTTKLEDGTLVDDEALVLGSYYTGYGPSLPSSTILEQNVGYDITYIDAEINNYVAWPDSDINLPDLLVSAIGRFDPQATAQALNNRDEWPSWVVDNHVTVNYRDIQINNWLDGNNIHIKDAYSPPHLDQLGRAMTFAVSDKFLFVGTSEEAVESMITSSLNKSKSLADVPAYSLVVQGLYDLDARMDAIAGDESLANGYWRDYENYQGPRLKQFLTFGTSFGKDDKGDYVALVLVHENSDMARDNVKLLEQRIKACSSKYYNKPWNELIYNTQIRSEGKILMAKLYTNDPSLWRTWFTSQDTLVLHEQ